MKRKKEDMDSIAPRVYAAVVCKLARLHVHPELRYEIELTSAFLQQIRLEATHLANLHVLRCCEEGIELPQLKQSFFYQCCARVMDAKTSGDPELDRTLSIYRASRSTVASYVQPHLRGSELFEYTSAHFSELAREMLKNATTMISANFHRRLYGYVRFCGPTARTARDAARIVRSVYREEGEFTLEEQRLRDWIGCIPTRANIKQQLSQFLAKSWEMLRGIEQYASSHPNTKGVRTFTVLPLTTSTVVSHITVNSSTLHALCARVFQRTKLNILNAPLTTKGIASAPHFHRNREQLMRAAFVVKGLETGTRRFTLQVSTNGYSASVLLTRPAALDNQQPTTARKRQKISASSASTSPRESTSRVAPVVTIGVDPGLRKLCTAVVADEHKLSVEPTLRRIVRQARRRRARGRKKRRHFRDQRHHDERKHRRQCNVDGKRVVKISSREFRHLAGSDKYRLWHENLKARKRGYRIVLENAPTFKTSSFSTFLSNSRSFWSNLRYMLRFSAKHGFLKWRFFLYTTKQKALHLVSKRLVPIASKRVCVGYGDWSKRDGIQGHPSTPVLGFERALKRRATVDLVDEFRTSKLCSECHAVLEQTIAPGTKKLNRNILRCDTAACSARFWDRDVNAALNILYLHQAELKRRLRPTTFCRDQQ